MQQDMIVILDLGSTQSAQIAREIRALGVYSEIHPHDITPEQVGALPNVKGIILNGGENRVVDGVAVDAPEFIYAGSVPVMAVDHTAKRADVCLSSWPEADDARREALRALTVNPCGIGNPKFVISAKLAPLPPSNSRIFAFPSLKRYT